MLTLCAIKSLFLNFKRPKIVFSEIVHKRTHQLKPAHTLNTLLNALDTLLDSLDAILDIFDTLGSL